MSRPGEFEMLFHAELKLTKVMLYLVQTGAHLASDGRGSQFHDQDRFDAYLIVMSRYRAVMAVSFELRNARTA
jgi:hypothetical protein